MTDPSSFAFHRLNPVYGRTALEAVTKRDAFGRKRNAYEQLSDLINTMVPISLRGLVNKNEQALWESALNSLGVTERRDTQSDMIQDLADKWKKSHGITEPGEFIYDRDKDPFRAVKLALVYQTPEQAADEMARAVKDGNLDYARILRFANRYGTIPFSGSHKNEAAFKSSLSSDNQKIYNDAMSEKKRIRENALKALKIYREKYATH